MQRVLDDPDMQPSPTPMLKRRHVSSSLKSNRIPKQAQTDTALNHMMMAVAD